MKTSSHVSSARTLCFALLTFSLVGEELARSTHQQIRDLAEAQRLFAICFRAAHAPSGSTPKSALDLHAKVPGVGDVTLVTEPASYETAYRVGATCDDCLSKRWSIDVTLTDETTPAEAQTELHRRARDAGAHPEPSDDYVRWYLEVEKSLFKHETEIPGTGIKLGQITAMWLLATLSVILLIKIRSRIRTVFADATRAADEPWILLDGVSALERLVAGIWLAAILVAPWIVESGLILTLAGQLRARGSQTTWYGDLAMIAGCLALPAVTGWVTITLASDFLRLRRDRIELRGAEQPPSRAA